METSLKRGESQFFANLALWKQLYPEVEKRIEQRLLQVVPPAFQKEVADRKEADEWFHSLSLEGIEVLYVYGVGLGDYYEAAKEWLRENPNHFIVFLEDDLLALRSFLETKQCHTLLTDGQAFLYFIEEESVQHAMFNDLSFCFSGKKYLLTGVKKYLQDPSKSYAHLLSKLSFFFSMNNTLLSELGAHGVAFFRNYFLNILHASEGYLGDRLFGKFSNIPAIICGAGPSLDKNIELLGTLTDRALIFAGGSGMNALNAKHLLPHFGVGIDPNPTQLTRLIMNTAYEVPFLYRGRMLFEALRLVHGDKLYVKGSGGYSIAEWMEKQLGVESNPSKDVVEISEGFNVLNLSVSLAHAFGCNPIICVGVDLAYDTKGASYASGIENHPIHEKTSNFRTRNLFEEIVVCKNIYGEPVNTLWKWMAEASWYTQCVERYPGTKFINATEGGLGFALIDNLTLKEVAERYLTKEYDLLGMVRAEVEMSRFSKEVTSQKVQEQLILLKESLVRFHKGCQGVIQLYEQGVAEEREMKQKEEELLKEVCHQALLDPFETVHRSSLMLLMKQQLVNKGRVPEKEWKIKEAAVRSAYHRRFTETAAALISLIDQVLQAFAADVQISTTKKRDDCVPGEVKWQKTYKEGLLEGVSLFYSKETPIAKTPFVNGKREGEATTYYLNGTLKSREYFVAGKLEGVQSYFYPDGQKKSELSYAEGKLHGIVTLYHPNGLCFRRLTFFEGEREGIEEMWDMAGYKRIEAHYRKGRPYQMARVWHPNGQLEREFSYDEQGNLISEKYWDPSGREIITPEEKKGDFFDQVNTQTKKLTQYFNQMVKGIDAVLPTVVEKMKEGVNFQPDHPQLDANLNEQFRVLQQEMERLLTIEKILTNQLEMDRINTREDLWKNPQVRELMEKNFDRLQKEIGPVDKGFEKIIEAFTPKKDKSGE